jgi:glycosyl transferase family 2
VTSIEVSVIVRSMARPTLARTLDSIAAQHGVALEVILVAACGAAHPPPPKRIGEHPLRHVASSVPLPRPDAANAGIDAARGHWVTWLDDDDQWLPGHLRGLLDVAAAQPSAGVIHSLAVVRVDGQPDRPFGQPMAPSELYVRNFIHASTALVARRLVDEGCRCDTTLALHEDWDWFIQCMQRAPFHFVRQRTFVWHAALGESGAGAGPNFDAQRVDREADRVRQKWAPARERLFVALTPVLARARAAVADGDWTLAATGIREAVALNPLDPLALALMGAVERANGRLAEAQAALALACVVRPYDATLVYNLALICRERGDSATVQECASRLGRMAPHDPRATALRAQLDGT